MRRLGDYDLLTELGRGAAGIVYRGRSAGGRDVAVKLLSRSNDGEVVARFERERRLLESLDETMGFVPLIEAGTRDGVPFLVMPLVPGGTLRNRLERSVLSIEETIAIVGSLARAMAHAHARGIVHRDLKPENVLFTEDGRPLIADLGLAKHFRRSDPGGSASVDLSRAGDFKGTPYYVAPEQLRDAASVGPPADVYALGAILYECLAGRPPIEAETMLALIGKIETEEPRPLAPQRPDAPSWLVAVAERALRKDPDERFEDGAALVRAIEAKVSPRRSALPLVGGLLVVVGGLALVALRSRGPSTPALPVPVDAASAIATFERADAPAALRDEARRVLAAALAGSSGDAPRLLDESLARAPNVELARLRATSQKRKKLPLVAQDLAAIASSTAPDELEALASHALAHGLTGERRHETTRALRARCPRSASVATLHGTVLLATGDARVRAEALASLEAGQPLAPRHAALLKLAGEVDRFCDPFAPSEPSAFARWETAQRRIAESVAAFPQGADAAATLDVLLEPVVKAVRDAWLARRIGPDRRPVLRVIVALLAPQEPRSRIPLLVAERIILDDPEPDHVSEEGRRLIARLEDAARALEASDPLFATWSYVIVAKWRGKALANKPTREALEHVRALHATAQATLDGVERTPAPTEYQGYYRLYLRHRIFADSANRERVAAHNELDAPRTAVIERALALRREALALSRGNAELASEINDDSSAVIDCCFALNRPRDAVPYCSALDAGDAVLAEIERRAGDPAKALAMAERALASGNPMLEASALAALALASTDLGRDEDARRYLGRLVGARSVGKVPIEAFTSVSVNAYVNREQKDPPPKGR